MKYKIFLVWLIYSSFLVYYPQSDQDKLIKSFKIITERFSDFFESPQKLLYKSSFSKSLTGINTEIQEYYLDKIGYDINKTESLISPYLGHIDLDLHYYSNCSCGNVNYKIGDYIRYTGWDTEKGAIDHANNKECYKGQLDISGKLDNVYTEEVRIYFVFQENKWIYKNVITRKEGSESTILAKAFMPSDDIDKGGNYNFNKAWHDLVSSTN